MHAPSSVEELLAALLEVGLPPAEVADIRQRLSGLPHLLEVYLQLAALLRPDHVFDATYYHASELTYRFALNRFPPDRRAWGNFGILMQEWGRYTEAIKYHELALALSPDYANAYINLGFCYEQAGDIAKAAAAMERAIQLGGPGAVPLTGLGNCAYLQGDYSRALLYYEEALKLHSTWTNAIFMKAVVQATLGLWAPAERSISALLQLNQSDAAARALERSISRRECPKLISRPLRPFERWSLRMRDAPPTGWNQDGPWGWVVTRLNWKSHPLRRKPPKVFISYRWDSSDGDRWTLRVAEYIAERGYQVVHDSFAPTDLPIHQRYRYILNQLSDASLFVPVLTNAYRRRVEAVGDLSSDVREGVILDMGRAFDEWTVALVLADLGRLRLLGLWRQGPVVAVPFTPETVVDVRNDKWQHQVAKAFPKRADVAGGLRYDSYPEDLPPSSGCAGCQKPDAVPKDLFEALTQLRVPKLQSRIVSCAECGFEE